MPNWSPVAQRWGLRRTAAPTRRHRGPDRHGGAETAALQPRQHSLLPVFGQQRGGGPPPQLQTYAEAAGSRSPPPPTQGAASEALHRDRPDLPGVARPGQQRAGAGADTAHRQLQEPRDRNPYAPTPPETVIWAQLLPNPHHPVVLTADPPPRPLEQGM